MPREKQFDEDEVIQQVTRAFWQKGYGACSVGDLVAASGLSRSSLYDTFGDKEQLFIRCLQYYDAQFVNTLRKIDEQEPTALEKIRAILRMPFLAQHKQASCAGCLTINTFSELPHVGSGVQQAVLQAKKNAEEFLAKWVREGQEKKEIETSDSPEALGCFLYTVMSGVLVSQKAAPDRAALEQTVALTISVLRP